MDERLKKKLDEQKGSPVRNFQMTENVTCTFHLWKLDQLT